VILDLQERLATLQAREQVIQINVAQDGTTKWPADVTTEHPEVGVYVVIHNRNLARYTPMVSSVRSGPALVVVEDWDANTVSVRAYGEGYTSVESDFDLILVVL
jgi:hypothetical protein